MSLTVAFKISSPAAFSDQIPLVVPPVVLEMVVVSKNLTKNDHAKDGGPGAV